MKKGTVPVLLFASLLSAPAAAELSSSPRLPTAMLWSLLPGGGFFYLGDSATGATYAGLTAAFVATGLEVERRNDEFGRDDEVNVPLLVGDKVWEYSLFSTFRTALAADGVDLRANRFDDTPTATLLTAPFRPQYALRWEVAAAVALGVAGAALSAHDRRGGRMRDISVAHMLGDDYGRDEATALYTASAFGVSLGAATAEEGIFRGALQSILQDRWGESEGFWLTAGLFGAAHIVAPNGELNPEGVLFATAAGAGLGWLYDHDGARLPGPIAAHFWYDFALIAGTWVLEPDDTPLGFSVDFRY